MSSKDKEQILKLYKKFELEINKFFDKKNQEQEEKFKNIKCFKIFNSYDFINYVENLYNVKTWNISNKTYEERANILKAYTYWYEIEEEFNSKKLLNKSINDSQLVSFFDTLYLMYNIINSIDNKLIDDIKIIMEYVIPDTTKERIDYIICYKNQMLLLEFSKANDFNDIKKVNTNKTLQVKNYAEKIKKYISNQIEISIETCIYLAEKNNNDKEHNSKQCQNIIKIINNLINRTYKDSIEELKNIKY